MSEKKLEECTLAEATHIEVNGKVHKLGDGEIVTKMEHPYGWLLGVWAEGNFQYINETSFKILGIKPMKEIKREPIEFEAIVKQDMPFAYLSNVPDGIPLGTKFRCVEILEEKK